MQGAAHVDSEVVQVTLGVGHELGLRGAPDHLHDLGRTFFSGTGAIGIGHTRRGSWV